MLCGASVVAVAGTVFLRGQKPSHAADGAPAVASAEAKGDFCAEGLEGIAGGGCFAAPADVSPNTPVPLIIYLHGRYANGANADELDRQARVARMGKQKGYATLALRGALGECTDPKLADWWCWPSNEKNAGDGAAFVARWSTAIETAEGRIGKGGPRYLLGFSNGAYFATLIATRALMPFDAVVVAHGGPVQPTRADGSKMPMLLVTADEDASNDEMVRLASELSREKWPSQIIAREGGHALPDWDVEMALSFFTRTRSEPMPLDPPLSTRPVKGRVEPSSAPTAPGGTASDGTGRVDPASPRQPEAALADTQAAIPDLAATTDDGDRPVE